MPDPTRYIDAEMGVFEKRIFEKEIVRIEDIAENALNNADAMQEVYDVKRGLIK
jgi:hypothetical protein